MKMSNEDWEKVPPSDELVMDFSELQSSVRAKQTDQDSHATMVYQLHKAMIDAKLDVFESCFWGETARMSQRLAALEKQIAKLTKRK